MFKIDRKNKTLHEVSQRNLQELNLLERDDLQQWIKTNPELISRHFETDLKIIAEEFDEFEVNDRLDLLAIDSEGTLVVIELKRKDSGSRIDIQGLKYASYCSTLSSVRIIEIYENYILKNNLDINAQEDLSEFLSTGSKNEEIDLSVLNENQRIILVAQNFDQRVKSVIAWLGKQEIDASCIEFKLFEDKDSQSLYMDSRQILPLESIDDFFVKDSSMLKHSNIRGKKARIPQPPEVVRFFSEYKQLVKEKYNLYPRGMDTRKYRTFKAGKVGLEFAFEIMKNQRRYKINLLAKSPSVKLLESFKKNKTKIKAPEGYTFQFIDPSQPDSESKWERIMIFVEPSPEKYLNDAEKMANITSEFMESLEPVLKSLKAA